MEQYTAGAEPPRKKKKYKDTALRIQTIVNDFENRQLHDYLRGIAHNLSFKKNEYRLSGFLFLKLCLFYFALFLALIELKKNN